MPILELQSVSKHFGAIHALNEVDLTLESGEVLGLMGDNGAGKSTLVKVIAGNFPPTHGEIRIDGRSGAFPQTRRGAPEGHRGRLSGPGALQQSVGGGQRVPGPRDQARRRAVPLARPQGDGQARGRTVRRAQVRDEAPRPRAPDVGRAAAGGRDRAHPSLDAAHGADGRADRCDLRAARSPKFST